MVTALWSFSNPGLVAVTTDETYMFDLTMSFL